MFTFTYQKMTPYITVHAKEKGGYDGHKRRQKGAFFFFLKCHVEREQERESMGKEGK